MTTDVRSAGLVTMDAQGRVLIPAEVRREQGWDPGQQLRVVIVDGHVVLLTPQDAGRLAQEIFQRGRPRDEGRSLVDELIAERRAAAARGD